MEGSVLFIGGTGTISWWCARAAQAAGWNVSALVRGRSGLRPLPEGVEWIKADVTDPDAFTAALAGREFDVVADFLSFDVGRLRRNVELLGPRTGQYIFISSASAYQKPVASLPITESTPLVNPFWQYARDKIACESHLVGLVREAGFPATIVRPSHTYDAVMHVTLGGWTDIARFRRGLPVVVPGDGTSLWTLTHASDFAAGFVPLFGERRAVGNTFHITGDEVLTWDAIYRELARAAGVRDPRLVHVASERIGQVIPEARDGLLGDKCHSVVFDNTKVRAIATGFAQKVTWRMGAAQYVNYHDGHPGAAVAAPELDAAFDHLAESA
ncbi:MAG: NAD-dependent epimerase/dehydratase family protein [Bifidobacteriaceae bacterium]|jgi:nucleoside-diphosphate-sugar epimerase|nr:NAD-dependent epimerase/dehydratase family protein [Bifidobacteriaceae bacterium]